MRNHGESEGKRRADGSENTAPDGRCVKEFQKGVKQSAEEAETVHLSPSDQFASPP